MLLAIEHPISRRSFWLITSDFIVYHFFNESKPCHSELRARCIDPSWTNTRAIRLLSSAASLYFWLLLLVSNLPRSLRCIVARPVNRSCLTGMLSGAMPYVNWYHQAM